MSRIGRMPISLPSNVEVTVGEGNLVTVKGPQGHPDPEAQREDDPDPRGQRHPCDPPQ